MINPTDIVTHLQAYVPAFTDLFSETVTGTATANGITVTVTTSSAHGLSVGRKIAIAATGYRNSIASAVDNGDGTIRFETAQEHDLTEPKAYADPTTLRLGGFANSAWNHTFTIVSVPNRKFFEVEFPAGESDVPSLTGAYLLESRTAGVVGVQTVETVPTATSFTFDVSGVPSLPTGEIENIKIITGIRVYGAADFERAQAAYTRLAAGKAALFVIMSDADVSKDRHTLNDGIAAFARSNIGKQIILQNFATTVFLPTEKQLAGHTAQNQAYGEVYRALASVLYGFEFDDPDTKQPYVCVNNGHGPGVYNSAYYTHVYDWQVPSVVTFENGYNLAPDVAWRDIVSSWALNSDDAAELSFNADLDIEPIE
jgi:hypothetical protein